METELDVEGNLEYHGDTRGILPLLGIIFGSLIVVGIPTIFGTFAYIVMPCEEGVIGTLGCLAVSVVWAGTLLFACAVSFGRCILDCFLELRREY